jgi:hypothetical protein
MKCCNQEVGAPVVVPEDDIEDDEIQQVTNVKILLWAKIIIFGFSWTPH